MVLVSMLNKKNVASVAMSAVLFAASSLVQAIPLGFIDNETSTIDTNTGLEWLDLTETMGRSYVDVAADITDDGGTFSSADGWRYATQSDFVTMVNNWFDPANVFTGEFTLYSALGNDDPAELNEFIYTFGDTIYSLYYDVGRYDSHLMDIVEGEGFSSGFLAVEQDGILRSGIVADWERTYRGVQYDEEDNLKVLSMAGGRLYNLKHPYANYGHYLVRDHDVSVVPLPATLPLFLTGLLGLGWLKRKKHNKNYIGV